MILETENGNVDYESAQVQAILRDLWSSGDNPEKGGYYHFDDYFRGP